jgi:hypothetical protein
MGTPSEEEWGDAKRLFPRLIKNKKEMPVHPKVQLNEVITNASS